MQTNNFQLDLSKGHTVSTTPETKDIPAILVLADGRTFRGFAFGAVGQTLGEAVFTTAMTGYQETMTDPSYHRQIVVSTAPQIGNTGWNDEDNENRDNKIWVAGLIIRDLSQTVSNWRAERSLEDEMKAQNIVGIGGVDTRQIVRHLRNFGSVSAGVFSGEMAEKPVEELLEIVKSQPSMEGADLAAEVSCTEPYELPAEGEERFTVVAYDLGIKSRTPHNFSIRGIKTVIVPANTPFAEIQKFNPDGIFISNGPGDPATADAMVQVVKDALEAKMPLFGICFGNQILGRALGLSTYKMKFGHRGVNIPVMDHTDGRIYITAQNHGFALEGTPGKVFSTPFGDAQVTHTCLNDDTVEGVALVDGSAFSVQYHPESAAGPHDANTLFDRFLELLESRSK